VEQGRREGGRDRKAEKKEEEETAGDKCIKSCYKSSGLILASQSFLEQPSLHFERNMVASCTTAQENCGMDALLLYIVAFIVLLFMCCHEKCQVNDPGQSIRE